MKRQFAESHVPARRSWPGWIGISCLLLAAPGCATFWDEITSHERDWRYITRINRPHPLEVLRDSSNGDRRGQALSELREPLRHGGNAQDQAVYLEVLQQSATKDPNPICRLKAIRCLGNYKDPRAARILEDVYQKQHFVERENNNLIRKEALVALENIHDPESRRLLIQVARGPGPEIVASLADRNETQDEKIVAIRALGKYPEQDSIEALYHVMRTENDVALRDRALQSLEEITGKRWPLERETWQKGEVQPLPPPNVIQQLSNWVPRSLSF